MEITKKPILIRWLLNPNCWIILFFVVRLIGITDPPLETGHNWRQSLTNMIARNFYEIDANILLPRVDMAGNETGIIGSEFPLMNYLMYLMSELFGYAHWYGRFINLCVSSVGILYFSKLIRLLFNNKVSFLSTIILLSSVWFAFARKIMPDTFSVSFVLSAIYFGIKFLRDGNRWHLLLYFLLATLGILSKIPALTLLSGFAVIFFCPQIDQRKRRFFALVTGFIIGIVCLWYFVWVPHLLELYSFQLYFPKGIKEGFLELVPLWSDALHKFYFSALHSFIGFAICMLGLFYLVKERRKYVLMTLGIMFLVFVVFIIKTGSVFPLHNYYIVTFVPVIAAVAGYGIAQVFNQKIQYLLLSLIVFEGVMNQQHDFRIEESELYKLDLAGIIKREIPAGERIVVNGGLSPQLMYFAHRKGWSISNTEWEKESYRQYLIEQGARYVVLDKAELNFRSTYDAFYEDAHFLFLVLENKDE